MTRADILTLLYTVFIAYQKRNFPPTIRVQSENSMDTVMREWHSVHFFEKSKTENASNAKLTKRNEKAPE